MLIYNFSIKKFPNLSRMKKEKLSKSLKFKDPVRGVELEFMIVPIEKLRVIEWQRKASQYHTKHLISSMERVGFTVPIIAIYDKELGNDNYLIIDGQHRYLAAKELGAKKLPIIVVPEEFAQKMMNFNIEKELNIREKSYVALNVYQNLLNEKPQMKESDFEIIDYIERAYYITLGLAYQSQEKIAGSAFEPILKKCDIFLDLVLPEAYKIRETRAKKILETNQILREIVEKLKETGQFHPYLYHQILSWANPYKRKRLPTDFDSLFKEINENLNRANANPQILKEVVEEIEKTT